MRFGIEDKSVEFNCFRRREKQIEILERLSEEEALHRIGFFFRNDALQPGVTFVATAVLNESAPHDLAHLQIMIWVKLRARFV